MRKPIYVRPITDDERKQLETGLRSSDAFVLSPEASLRASELTRRVCDYFGFEHADYLSIPEKVA